MNEVIDLALSILRKKSIDGYDVYLVQSSHFDVESKDGKIETLQTSQYSGIALRILHRQRMGFSYTTFSDPSGSARQKLSGALDRVIEDAVRSAAATPPDPVLTSYPLSKPFRPRYPFSMRPWKGFRRRLRSRGQNV